MRLAVVLGVLGLVASAHAGAIEGRATPDQEIVVDTVPATFHRLTHADRTGRFRVGQLEPGWYTVALGNSVTYVRVTSQDVTTVGAAIDRLYLTQIPLGDTFDYAIGVAPTARNDGYGIALAGATSLENRYRLDGLDVTGTRAGTLEVHVANEFVETVDVLEAGAGPTWGRGTGGFVDVTTRHGSNEFAGSVFGSWSPGELAAAPKTIGTPGTIEITSRDAYAAQLGGTLEGPIVKDRAWFFVGYVPSFSARETTRTIRSQIDHDGDGNPDLDSHGVPSTVVVDRRVLSAPSRGDAAVARLDLAVDAHNTASVSAYDESSATTNPAIFAAPSTGTRTTHDTKVISGRWRAHYGNVELDASVGLDRTTNDLGASDPSAAHQPQRRVFTDNITDVEPIAQCKDGGSGDPYPTIVNCPVPFTVYDSGGPGVISHDLQQRLAGAVAVRDRVGAHVVELGLDGEDATLEAATRFSGGALLDDDGAVSYTQRAARLGGSHTCYSGFKPHPCELLDDSLDDPTGTRSLAWTAYGRDVWTPRAGLLIDAALRYDAQHVKDVLDVDDVAPRLGIAVDPSGEGRAKLFAHWGRYVETVPLSVAAEVHPDHVTYTQAFECLQGGPTCTPDVVDEFLYPLVNPTVAAKIRAPYVDELAFGAQLAVGGLELAASVIDRRLHHVLEDESLDGNFLTIANPGSSRVFDPPTRVFDALELSIARSFSPLYLRASYTYSRLFGDYSGWISYDTGQVDPHTSSEYDDVAEMADRRGLLPQDRTHVVKLDAAYEYAVNDWTSFVIGARFRALSGVPETALDSYGQTALLPRGAFGRTDFTTGLDLHFLYRQRIAKHRALELYVDVLDLFDDGVYAVDNIYTNDEATAISGGAFTDLMWLRQGNITNLDRSVVKSVTRNPTFHQPAAYYAPLATRLGFRFRF